MAKKFIHIDSLSAAEYEIQYRLFCSRCQLKKPDVEEQYSYGVYAGRYCRDCAIHGFRDACGQLDGQQGDPNELDEPLEED